MLLSRCRMLLTTSVLTNFDLLAGMKGEGIRPDTVSGSPEGGAQIIVAVSEGVYTLTYQECSFVKSLDTFSALHLSTLFRLGDWAPDTRKVRRQRSNSRVIRYA
jgi:hypothetical protein